MLIASDNSIQSPLTACHFGLMSLAPGMRDSNHCVAVYLNAASVSFSTENLIIIVLHIICVPHAEALDCGSSESTDALYPLCNGLLRNLSGCYLSVASPSTRLTSIDNWKLSSLLGHSAFVPDSIVLRPDGMSLAELHWEDKSTSTANLMPSHALEPTEEQLRRQYLRSGRLSLGGFKSHSFATDV